MQIEINQTPGFKTYNFDQELLIENHVWITAKRERVFVRDMTTSHIRNCINCLNGTGNMRIPFGYLGGTEKWLKIFNNELQNRQ